MYRFATLAAALTLGLFTLTGVAHAQEDREMARVQFERGVGLYETHDYEGALASFQEAYRLAPHPTVRVNMANCYEHLDRPLEAIHHFERFLAESPNSPRPQRREVEAALERLRTQVGEVRLAVAPDGARITIDEHETRRAPVLEPILLTVGDHTVVVTMDGFRTARETVTIAGGDTQSVSIRLERGTDEPAAVAATEPAEQPAQPATTTGDPAGEEGLDEPEGEATAEATLEGPAEDDGGGFELRLTTPVIIFGAATAAFGVGAIVTGALAVSYNSEFDTQLAIYESTRGAERRQAAEDGRSAADTANALSIVTDVLIIGTIAAAGATAFFVIIDGLGGDDDEMASNDGVQLMVTPSASPNGGGVALNGWF